MMLLGPSNIRWTDFLGACVAILGSACGSAQSTGLEASTSPSPAAAPMVRVTADGAGDSCEHAREAWVVSDSANIASTADPTEEQDQEMKTTLNQGTYLTACNVPTAAAVSICVAVVEGAARGITVVIDPALQRHADCVAAALSKMPFPAHSRMSVARTTFAPEP
jgi:hypothetical protein